MTDMQNRTAALNRIRMILCLVMVVALIPGVVSGTELPETLEEASALFAGLKDGQPQYEAQAATDFHIRNLPRDQSYWLLEIEKTKNMQVLLYGEEWCVVEYRDTVGFARTRWLNFFRSLDPFRLPVPDLERQSGIATVMEPVSAAVEDYAGNTFSAGDIVAILEYGSGQAEINMMRSTATLPVETLSYTPFPSWENAQPGDYIAAFTTYFNEKTGGNLSENRRFNIELAVERIDGTTLKPGETFSFNEFCGPYRRSNGYMLAPAINQAGKGYGGGVCQVATTLYNAVLNLPLQVEKWNVHRDIGVAYIKPSFDAAVGTYSDLAFSNTLSYPVTIHALSQNGVLTILISRGV